MSGIFQAIRLQRGISCRLLILPIMMAASAAHASHTMSVVDFGGINHQIVVDANNDAFVVESGSGQLYVYDVLNTNNPGNGTVYRNKVAAVPGVTVVNGTLMANGEALGEIVMDQKRSGRQFAVLAYDTGLQQGYLDVDFNKNYRGVFDGDKRDPRITQQDAVAFSQSYKGLYRTNLWPTGGKLSAGENHKSLARDMNTRFYEFTTTDAGTYQIVLRDYEHPSQDLDVRLVDLKTGRILGSSYSANNGELITLALKAKTRFGVVVERSAGSGRVNFVLSVKPASENDQGWSMFLGQHSETPIKMNGTLHTSSRLAHLTLLPWLGDASTDTSGDAYYFENVWTTDASSDASNDTSGDASGDSLYDAIKNIAMYQPDTSADVADSDSFLLLFRLQGLYHYVINNSGGETLTTIISSGFPQTVQEWAGASDGVPVLHPYTGGSVAVKVEDNRQSGDTIEYEVLIQD